MLKAQKKIIKSSTFNLLNVYSGVIVGIFSTILIARLITPEEWGYLFIAQSYISTAMVICTFFPPAAESSMNYYIPQFIIKDGRASTEIRRIFFHVYKIRLIGIFIIYIIFLMILIIANFGLEINQIIFVISPMLLFSVLLNLNIAFLLAFQKFKWTFFINLINSLLYTLLIFLIFILQLKDELILIAYVILFCSILSCFISVFFIIPLVPKKSETNLDLNQQTQINFFKIHKSYGLNLVIEGLLSHFTILVLYLIFLNSGFVVFITYFAICESVVGFILNFSISNRNFYISIFSEIYFRKEFEILKRTFYQLSKYLLFFAFFIISVLFYFIDLYITIIYSQKYLIIKFAIQIFLFSAISRLLVRNLLIITQSTNNTWINTQMALFRTFFILSFSIVGLLFYNFTILAVFYVFALFLLIIVLFYLINKKVKFKLNFFQVFKPVIIFIISLIISFIISYFIEFRILTDNYLFNLIFNSTLKLVTFFIIFYIVIFLTRFITKEELDQIKEIFPKIHLKNYIVRKLFNLIRFFLPSNRKD